MKQNILSKIVLLIPYTGPNAIIITERSSFSVKLDLKG